MGWQWTMTKSGVKAQEQMAEIKLRDFGDENAGGSTGCEMA